MRDSLFSGKPRIARLKGTMIADYDIGGLIGLEKCVKPELGRFVCALMVDGTPENLVIGHGDTPKSAFRQAMHKWRERGYEDDRKDEEYSEY